MIEVFDFDEWANLAKSDPDQFERKRAERLERLIEQRGNQRLKGLQWKIEAERSRKKSDLKFCLHLYTMMWDSFIEFKDVSNEFVYKKAQLKIVQSRSLHSNVISFPQPCKTATEQSHPPQN